LVDELLIEADLAGFSPIALDGFGGGTSGPPSELFWWLGSGTRYGFFLKVDEVQLLVVLQRADQLLLNDSQWTDDFFVAFKNHDRVKLRAYKVDQMFVLCEPSHISWKELKSQVADELVPR